LSKDRRVEIVQRMNNAIDQFLAALESGRRGEELQALASRVARAIEAALPIIAEEIQGSGRRFALAVEANDFESAEREAHFLFEAVGRIERAGRLFAEGDEDGEAGTDEPTEN
jgi:hypothetical protein